MAGITLDAFRGAVQELARPNRFMVAIETLPPGLGNVNWDDEMIYHCKAASIPGRTLGEMSMTWMGNVYKLAGDPTFDDIQLTFINNASFSIRESIELWIDGIANVIKNTRSSHLDYKGTLRLDQFGSGNNVIARYYLHGVWPKTIDAIEMSHETGDSIEEFSVTFSVDYWSGTDTYGAGETTSVGRT